MGARSQLSLITLEREACLALLASVPLGRVGISVGALPVVLPVNFALVGHGVVLRTAAGTKLHAATTGAVVAFEADGYDADGSQGWSVVVQGVASEIHDPARLAEAVAARIPSWALDDAADHYIRIEATVVTGRRFHRPALPG